MIRNPLINQRHPKQPAVKNPVGRWVASPAVSVALQADLVVAQKQVINQRHLKQPAVKNPVDCSAVSRDALAVARRLMIRNPLHQAVQVLAVVRLRHHLAVRRQPERIRLSEVPNREHQAWAVHHLLEN